MSIMAVYGLSLTTVEPYRPTQTTRIDIIVIFMQRRCARVWPRDLWPTQARDRIDCQVRGSVCRDNRFLPSGDALTSSRKYDVKLTRGSITPIRACLSRFTGRAVAPPPPCFWYLATCNVVLITRDQSLITSNVNNR